MSKEFTSLTTKELFIYTVLATALLRFSSFLLLVILDVGRINYSIQSGDLPDSIGDTELASEKSLELLEKASVVLFDFPDFCFISSYVLLLVIWAEAYLKSRQHWLSSLAFQRVWILGYLVFNVLLYGSQIGLYSLLFIPTIDQEQLCKLIFLTLTFFNIGLPFLWLAIFLYLTIRFAGFPFASTEAKERLKYLSRVGAIWTISRLGWGFISLTAVLQDWLEDAKRSDSFYTCVLIGIFFIAEILPILFSLQRSVLGSLVFKKRKDQSTSDSKNIDSRHMQHLNRLPPNDILSPLIQNSQKEQSDAPEKIISPNTIESSDMSDSTPTVLEATSSNSHVLIITGGMIEDEIQNCDDDDSDSDNSSEFEHQEVRRSAECGIQ